MTLVIVHKFGRNTTGALVWMVYAWYGFVWLWDTRISECCPHNTALHTTAIGTRHAVHLMFIVNDLHANHSTYTTLGMSCISLLAAPRVFFACFGVSLSLHKGDVAKLLVLPRGTRIHILRWGADQTPSARMKCPGTSAMSASPGTKNLQKKFQPET